MIEGLIEYFASTLGLACFAFIAGRYIGRSPPPLTGTFGRDLLIFVQVWGLTTFAKVAFSLLGHVSNFSQSFQSGLAGFLLPIVVGGYFARQLLRLHEQRATIATKHSQAEADEEFNVLTDQARTINQIQPSQIRPSTGVVNDKGRAMKWTAIFLNLVLLLTMGYTLATKGAPGENELFFVILFCATPLASLVALTRAGGESWLGLYFRRKALEEKQRIKNLEGN